MKGLGAPGLACRGLWEFGVQDSGFRVSGVLRLRCQDLEYRARAFLGVLG